MEIDARIPVYVAMYQLMNKHYQEDREDQAFKLAHRLLADLELPDFARASCHMILSTDDDEPFYLAHAKEADRIYEEHCRSHFSEEDFPTVQYKEAKRLLAEAENSHKEDITKKDAETARIADGVADSQRSRQADRRRP
ncbi:hypothetical protein LTR78_008690 [Recurvomyces mirabilis]|uniref:Uncharacterized protein n=1 Tax=Recurvomyces mirabilis TaxID=574656 RepID=A0AAE0WFM1_9PEZI|nr:hypothetical protein LTR78_008690 [Recurvomyces mirabilis]KAK5159225.1 hypothetical protein LTS14_002367 [Recurvomyces mirabilis]